MSDDIKLADTLEQAEVVTDAQMIIKFLEERKFSTRQTCNALIIVLASLVMQTHPKKAERRTRESWVDNIALAVKKNMAALEGLLS